MSDDQRRADSEYARQSFTFRRMRTWQVWSITAAGAAVIIALLVYAWA